MKKEEPHTKEAKGLHHILKYTGIFGMVQVLNMIMNIIRNKVAAVFLGPAGMGMLDMYNKASNMLSESTNLGLNISGVKYVSEESSSGIPSRIQQFCTTLRTYSLIVGLLGMGVCICCHWIFRYTYTTVNFFFLSPVILFMAISGGELAILKGTKQLKSLTKVSIFAAFIILAVYTPFFYLKGMAGIIWALIVGQFIVTLVTLYYSTKSLPYRIRLFSKEYMKKGLPMLKMGLGLIVAGMMGKGTELFINSFIEQTGGLDDVGLFNRGYTMAVVYASIIFSAMDADFYPRLSSTGSNIPLQNQTINRQIEVCVLLISPFLIFFTIGMPILVPVLFTNEFTTCIPMAIGAMMFMYFRALILPVGYLALARSDSKMYMFTEFVYDVVTAIAVPLVYVKWGLTATGFTISACGLLDTILIYSLYRHRYKFRFDTSHLRLYAFHGILTILAVVLVFMTEGWLRWTAGISIGLISLSSSIYTLSRETDVFKKLKSKFRSRPQ